MFPLSIIQKTLQYLEGLKNKNRQCRDVFSEIYLKRKWALLPTTGQSGPGSYDDIVVGRHIAVISDRIKQAPSPITLVDLGCGDMNVSKFLLPFCDHFIGVDVVPAIVKNNNLKNWGHPSIRFECVDITQDPLPKGNIAVLRQVLQHLANNQIQQVLSRLREYSRCFITEHHPINQNTKTLNKDLVHGRWNRVTSHSGVFLDAPPFNIPSQRLTLLLETPGIGLFGQKQGIFRTYELTNEP
jgi:hypothetical protein